MKAHRKTNTTFLIYMWNLKMLNLEAEPSSVIKDEENEDNAHSV